LKKFMIPLINRQVNIYVGPNEWKAWKRRVESMGPIANPELLEKVPDGDSGRTYGSIIWVNMLNRNTLIHELSHFLDCLFSILDSADTEFRAYTTAYIITAVTQWADTEINKEEPGDPPT